MRRTTWAAAPALALVVVLSGCASEPEPPVRAKSSPTAETADADHDWRWVALRDVEVEVPAGWGADHAAVRPDCIQGGGPRDPWARDVPDRPYVSVGTSNRPAPLIGCFPERAHAPAFGALPFELWQPYVALAAVRADLADQDPTSRDGQWEHRGWRLTRRTAGEVQVSVLAPPDDADLAERVLGSVRRVETTDLGCDTASPVQAEDFVTPEGGAVPPALRFFGGDGSEPLGEAFVYYDWCFGNGIVDAAGTRALTRENCPPLFAEPPITLWSGQAPVVEVCGPLGAGRR